VLLAVEQTLITRSKLLPIGSDTLLLALVHVSVILIGLLVFLLARNAVKPSSTGAPGASARA
jgi:hypothetical protein